ncbi:hypothetical protein CHS0354_012305 [Potamilus streckersoni]|uniref:Uncharacterized protein n=1 Tax=Potamilus streckersoni TaxID=2493646 RepID=A0AAE0SJK1_9BIVA|nr:hypothetical protein CHS0354_012305 [Potamilus streckersoni]
MANQLKASFTKYRFAKRATQKDNQGKRYLMKFMETLILPLHKISSKRDNRHNKIKRQINNGGQSQAKRPRTENKSQQISSNTTNEQQTIGRNGKQPMHKLQPHPRYLTLYLKSPTNAPITLSDSAIRIELMKHKSGNLKIIRTKSSDIIVWCYSGAQMKAYKKIKQIDNIPVNLINHYAIKGNTPTTTNETPRKTNDITKSTINPENKQTKNNYKGGFLIWQWNCRGIHANCRELQANLQETKNKPMIICLQETNLRTKNPKLPKIKKYEKIILKKGGMVN